MCDQVPSATLFALAIFHMPGFTIAQVSLKVFSVLSILHMENGSSRLSNFPKEHETGLKFRRHRLCLVQ